MFLWPSSYENSWVILLEPTVKADTVAVIPDSSKVTISPTLRSNSFVVM